MKKYGFLILILVCLLTGCQSVPTFETLGDVYASQELSQMREMKLDLPEGAAVQTVTGDTGTIYFCDGYEILLETMRSGDLNATLRSLTGFEADTMTLLQTKKGDYSCWECAWTSAGEAGFQVGRTMILDDGKWHYCLSVLAPAQEAGNFQNEWQPLFASFGIV